MRRSSQSVVYGCGKDIVGDQGPRKNSGSHIDASHSRQPLVKGERLVRYEVNAVITISDVPAVVVYVLVQRLVLIATELSPRRDHLVAAERALLEQRVRIR